MRMVHDNIIYLCCEVVNDNYLSYTRQPSEKAKFFLELLNRKSEYEINSIITKEVERHFLGQVEYPHLNDQFDKEATLLDLDSPLVYQRSNPYVFLTVHKKTKLAILLLLDPSLDTDPSMDADQISRRNIFLNFDGEAHCFNCFLELETHLGLRPLDTPKLQVTMEYFTGCDSLSNHPESKFYSCLLLGEAFNSEYYHHTSVSDRGRAALETNLKQYDFYELYSSPRVLLYIVKEYGNSDIDNIDQNTDLIFVVELVLLQNSAILKINKNIVEALSRKSKVKFKEIGEMYVKFGESMLLREKNVFKYLLVQNLADKLTAVFEFDRLFQDYQYNQQHLEHIVQLRASRTAEIESRVINFVAIFLALVQIVPLLSEWNHHLGVMENIQNMEYYMLSFGMFVTVIIFLVIIKNRKNRSKN